MNEDNFPPFEAPFDHKTPGKPDSPNRSLDAAVKKLLKDSEGEPFELRIKALGTAIVWQKVKHAIMEKSDEFNPEEM